MSSSRRSEPGVDLVPPGEVPLPARPEDLPEAVPGPTPFGDPRVVRPAGADPTSGTPASSDLTPDAGPRGRAWRERLASVRGHVRPWPSWTLRAKLVASMLALFTVISLATGAFTVVALNRQLTSQVDEQLQASMVRLGGDGDILQRLRPDPGGRPRGPGDEGLLAYLPTDSTGRAPLGTVSVGGQGDVSLGDTQLAELQDAGLRNEPRTLQLTGLGPYRVLAATGLDQARNPVGVIVVGLPVGQQQRTMQQMVLVVMMTVGAGVVLVALLGTWIVRRNLEPLSRLAATATKVSRMPLHSGAVALAGRVDPADTDERTEVGQVGAAFNDMLGHVDEALNARHQSEQRVRQFVADASHELRTPLASIKGYAELSRREPEPVPQSVTHAMGRIESEADRMGSLVEDLLLLARLDAGRPLDDEPVDVSMLVINAVSDAHAAAPGHRWDLDLPPEPVEVRGDGARLHQVVANLLGNARTHTPEGTRVTTSVRREGDWVRVAVHDDGPGVPASLRPNVFERFARGDDARNRAGGSTGLGLSIVAAVSKAHGGRVELESRPGDTTFSLLLPAGA